jgi:DNA-binding MarR family transcriptional regulator
MGPVELAKALGVTSAAASGVVDRLVARGHAERRPHAADGRRTEVVVTESGRHEVFALLAPMFTGLAEIDAPLTADERALVERYLRGAIAAMRSVT